jgi:anti-anti-sigma factor
MAVSMGVVQYHCHDKVVHFRVEGRGTMAVAPSFRHFAEACLAKGFASYRIDLRHCTFMDSTFLGTLLSLQGYVARLNTGSLTLVSPSAACAKGLEQMGLTAMLSTESADEIENVEWLHVPPAPADGGTFRRTVEEAHEELAALPGPAGESFRAVVECMTKAAANAEGPKKSMN